MADDKNQFGNLQQPEASVQIRGSQGTFGLSIDYRHGDKHISQYFRRHVGITISGADGEEHVVSGGLKVNFDWYNNETKQWEKRSAILLESETHGGSERLIMLSRVQHLTLVEYAPDPSTTENEWDIPYSDSYSWYLEAERAVLDEVAEQLLADENLRLFLQEAEDPKYQFRTWTPPSTT